MDRKPAVAGSFYPARAETLREAVASRLEPGAERQIATAILVPHAGYIYSGACAGKTYSRVRVPAVCLLLGPNHTGLGSPLSVSSQGAWITPLGRVPIDTDLAGRLLSLEPRLRDDPRAHVHEHSVEVQLPFLQVVRPDVRIVPICIGARDRATLRALGQAIASAIGERRGEILIVISSDMSHYIPFEEARVKDALAIERMERLDPGGLHQVVDEGQITMCGVYPAVAGLAAAGALGAKSGRLVSYTSSGDLTGDFSSVVAYAGLIFH